MRNLKLLFIVFVPLVIFQSCIEKEFDFENIKSQNWESQWAMPLINSRLTLNDILNDTANIIHENQEGVITLVYESKNLMRVGVDDVIEIPDQEKTENEIFELPLLPSGMTANVPVPFSFTFQMEQEGTRIDSIIVKSGFYSFSVRTDLDRDNTWVDFDIPNFIHKTSGHPLQFTMDFSNPSGINELGKDTLIDLSEYNIVFNDAFGDTNEIYINCLVHFESDDNPLNNPYFIILENNFTNLELYKFFGYAGQRTISMDDTLSIDLFDVNQEGNFSFEENSVTLKMDIRNSFGLPLLLDVKTFRAYHGGTNPDSMDIFIFGEGNPALIEVNSPGINEIGEYESTGVLTENSNLHEAIEISPNKIYVDIEGTINVGESLDITNFILDTSTIEVDMLLELALFGAIEGFKIADTVDFEMSDLDDVQSLLFVVDVENGFPINAMVQLEFVDSVYNVVHTLLPENEQLMIAAPVGSGPKYRVVSPSYKLTEIIVEKEDIENLKEARKILITAVLSTTENQVVKIYSDYGLLLRLGAKFGLRL